MDGSTPSVLGVSVMAEEPDNMVQGPEEAKQPMVTEGHIVMNVA